MIIAILIFILSILFLAGFFNLKFPNSTKKLFSQLKNPFFTSPASSSAPALQSSSSSVSPRSTNLISKNGGLKEVFDTFDKNGDGFITRQELRQSLSNIGIFVPAKEVEEMVDNLDSNRDGLIDVGEFQELFELLNGRDKKKVKSEEGKEISDENEDDDDNDNEGDLKEAFDVFDGDKDGLITVEELELVVSSLGLKEGKRKEDFKEMIKKVDVDGDGMVNFDEFKNMMRDGFGAAF